MIRLTENFTKSLRIGTQNVNHPRISDTDPGRFSPDQDLKKKKKKKKGF
jgi:hypothetical protein